MKSYAWMVDLNADLSSEAITTASDQKTSAQFLSLGVLGDLGKSETMKYYLGWGIISASSKNTNSTAGVDQSFSTLDMGPTFRVHFDKKGLYTGTLTYALFAKGTLVTGATSEAISGSSMHLKFAVEPEVTERFFIGFALNYYSATYTKSVLNSTESSVSYKVQRTFPSFSLSYRY